ncbi:hypothetical protein SISNIDRAFT_406839 [Sistotremastrum niveocremeum HHB9708]|uniref:Chitin synthase export chaperone n=1 Tax=Sistotremastrum niveocremeum HHB9708 TaxID=1314777 RepID=A0A164YK36_9AGAM|nr:hypothetical protein SISNIDRAFT_406839 [Sistotremastrum niveocremeum HHB9708]
MNIKFGSFDSICQTAALIVCPLVGTEGNREPSCYSRNVLLGGTLIFQPSTCFVHIAAVMVAAMMINLVTTKYIAQTRLEMLVFLYLYAIIEFMAIFLDSGIIHTASSAYMGLAALYTSLVAAAYCCLLLNGFGGFEIANYGPLVPLKRLSLGCLVVFSITLFISTATFKSSAGLSASKPIGLWIIHFLWPLFTVVSTVVIQLYLTITFVHDKWLTGCVLLGVFFFAAAQVLLFAFSVEICNSISHYIDGLFFFTLCMLLSVMMVYKYWDSMVKEDLEFSVGQKRNPWQVPEAELQASEVAQDNSYPDSLDITDQRDRHLALSSSSSSSVEDYGQDNGYRSVLARYPLIDSERHKRLPPIPSSPRHSSHRGDQ